MMAGGSHGLAFASLVVVVGLAFVNSRPVKLDNHKRFQTRRIIAEDFAKDRCGFTSNDGCKQCTPTDCPFATFGFESEALGPEGGPLKPGDLIDYVTTVGSVIGGIPSVTVANCKNASSYSLAPKDPESMFWSQVINNYAKSQSPNPQYDMQLLSFGPAQDIGGNIQFLVFLIEELVEYQDNDDDGRFTPTSPTGQRIDTVVQRVPLASMKWHRARYRHWVDNKTGHNDAQIDQLDHSANFEFSITNADGTFTMTMTAGGVPAATPSKYFQHPELITPNNTRLTFEIKNFKYIGKNTRLAVKTILSSDADDAFVVVEDRMILLADKSSHRYKGFLHWGHTANVLAGVGVDAGVHKQDVVYPTKPGLAAQAELSYSLGKTVITSSPGSQPHVVYFSFGGTAYQPALIEWDAAFGYGGLPLNQTWQYWPTLVMVLLIAMVLLCMRVQGVRNVSPCVFDKHTRRCFTCLSAKRFAVFGGPDLKEWGPAAPKKKEEGDSDDEGETVALMESQQHRE